MKKISIPVNFKMAVALLVFNFMQLVLWAQEETTTSGGSSSTTTKSTKIDVSTNNADNWYASPWVWIIGAALFILLLVALLRGNSSRTTRADSTSTDRVTVTKTVERDTDINP